MFLSNKARLIQYGMLVDHQLMFASEKEYEPLLQVVTFANSFAMNMVDGSLSRINHKNEEGQSLVTLIRDTPLKSGEHLFHVITGDDSLLSPSFRDDILQKFIFETMGEMNASEIGKIHSEDPVKFFMLMNGIVDDVDDELSAILEKEIANFTVTQEGETQRDASVHYIGISTSGIPVVNQVYGTEFVSRFKLPAKDNTSPEDVLKSLLSAQLSAIVQSSKNEAKTLIKDISIKYFQPKTRKYKELSITFFPINEQFVLELCYDGSRTEIEEFMSQNKSLFNQLINKPFRGNLQELGILEKIFRLNR